MTIAAEGLVAAPPALRPLGPGHRPRHGADQKALKARADPRALLAVPHAARWIQVVSRRRAGRPGRPRPGVNGGERSVEHDLEAAGLYDPTAGGRDRLTLLDHLLGEGARSTSSWRPTPPYRPVSAAADAHLRRRQTPVDAVTVAGLAGGT